MRTIFTPLFTLKIFLCLSFLTCFEFSTIYCTLNSGLILLPTKSSWHQKKNLLCFQEHIKTSYESGKSPNVLGISKNDTEKKIKFLKKNRNFQIFRLFWAKSRFLKIYEFSTENLIINFWYIFMIQGAKIIFLTWRIRK